VGGIASAANDHICVNPEEFIEHTDEIFQSMLSI
jgi:hypothetical protein